MKKVAKLVIIDPDGTCLLLRRSNHPVFGADPDLPGGTLEGDETVLQTVLREVYEETGVAIDASGVQQAYSGTDYSAHGTQHVLFVAYVQKRPAITLSWEHDGYEWLERGACIARARVANDRYMHMVADVLQRLAGAHSTSAS